MTKDSASVCWNFAMNWGPTRSLQFFVDAGPKKGSREWRDVRDGFEWSSWNLKRLSKLQCYRGKTEVSIQFCINFGKLNKLKVTSLYGFPRMYRCTELLRDELISTQQFSTAECSEHKCPKMTRLNASTYHYDLHRFVPIEFRVCTASGSSP